MGAEGALRALLDARLAVLEGLDIEGLDADPLLQENTRQTNVLQEIRDLLADPAAVQNPNRRLRDLGLGDVALQDVGLRGPAYRGQVHRDPAFRDFTRSAEPLASVAVREPAFLDLRAASPALPQQPPAPRVEVHVPAPVWKATDVSDLHRRLAAIEAALTTIAREVPLLLKDGNRQREKVARAASKPSKTGRA